MHLFDTKVSRLLRPLLFECDTRLSFAQFCDKVDELKLPPGRLVSHATAVSAGRGVIGRVVPSSNSDCSSADSVGFDGVVPGSEVADVSELDIGLDCLWWG